MNETELKPCPFCGAEAELTEISGRWTVKCAKGCAGTRIFNDKSRPVAAWNRRTEPVYCKDCKYWEDFGEYGYNGRCWGKENGLVREYTYPDDFCSYGERKEEGK